MVAWTALELDRGDVIGGHLDADLMTHEGIEHGRTGSTQHGNANSGSVR
jgi:hypothetical protein